MYKIIYKNKTLYRLNEYHSSIYNMYTHTHTHKHTSNLNMAAELHIQALYFTLSVLNRRFCIIFIYKKKKILSK